MMSLSMIHEVQRQAARAARRVKKQPLLITAAALSRAKAGDLSAIAGIPSFGTYKPTGWKRVNLTVAFEENDDMHGVNMGDGFGAYFVDKTGWGDAGEPALTIKQFVERHVREGYGYAVIEEGQFQIYVACYKPIVRKS